MAGASRSAGEQDELATPSVWKRSWSYIAKLARPLAFQRVTQDERVIKEHVKSSERPRVWVPWRFKWAEMEVIGRVRSHVQMYGVVNRSHPGSKRHPRVHLVYPELMHTGRPPSSDRLLPCYEWHQRRRARIVRAHPEIRQLMSKEHKPNYVLWFFAFLLVHAVCSAASARLWRGGGWLGVAGVVAMAATIGAAIAFNLQQLTHEVCHNVRSPGVALHTSMFLSDLSFGVCGPGWHAYYMMLHLRHHGHAGSEEDPDVSFQSYWSVLPRCLSRSRLGRVAWVTIFAALTQPVVLLCHWCGHNQLNFLMERKVALAFVLSSKWSFWALVAWFLGPGALAYLWAASAFSLGAFCHPYLGFWLIQHLAAPYNFHQPTVSYGGSDVWHWLNLQVLRHVEHHDFPNIPFTKAAEVRRIAPEFYDGLFEVKSIRSIIWRWASHTDGTAWMDFAANQKWELSRYKPPLLVVTNPEDRLRGSRRRAPVPGCTEVTYDGLNRILGSPQHSNDAQNITGGGVRARVLRALSSVDVATSSASESGSSTASSSEDGSSSSDDSYMESDSGRNVARGRPPSAAESDSGGEDGFKDDVNEDAPASLGRKDNIRNGTSTEKTRPIGESHVTKGASGDPKEIGAVEMFKSMSI